MVEEYNPDTCDLCGSTDREPLVNFERPVGLASGSTVLPVRLSKLICNRCGLMRNAEAITSQELARYYSDEYNYNTAMGENSEEHHFFLDGKKIARSELLFEWITDLCPSDMFGAGKRLLEVGCGQGNLLGRMKAASESCDSKGLELNARAAGYARRKGLNVENKPLENEPDQRYDSIYAIGVLEHVPSPKAFLSGIYDKLKPGGYLLIAQPTQDVPSYDIFYVDHLHHFAKAHLDAYARVTGFEPVKSETGHKALSNFSMHLSRRTDPAQPPTDTAFVETTARRTISAYREVFRDVNEHLRKDLHRGRKLGVFGLSNVFALLRAYTDFAEHHIAELFDCGIDDVPDKHKKTNLPVVSPREALCRNLDRVYVCTNPVYHRNLMPRLKKLGFNTYNCLGTLKIRDRV